MALERAESAVSNGPNDLPSQSTHHWSRLLMTKNQRVVMIGPPMRKCRPGTTSGSPGRTASCKLVAGLFAHRGAFVLSRPQPQTGPDCSGNPRPRLLSGSRTCLSRRACKPPISVPGSVPATCPLGLQACAGSRSSLTLSPAAAGWCAIGPRATTCLHLPPRLLGRLTFELLQVQFRVRLNRPNGLESDRRWQWTLKAQSAKVAGWGRTRPPPHRKA